MKDTLSKFLGSDIAKLFPKFIAIVFITSFLFIQKADAETYNTTVTCSGLYGGAECTIFNDENLKASMSEGSSKIQQVELLGASFDDSGRIVITSPSGKTSTITTAAGCAQTLAYDDISEYFAETGSYKIRIEAKNDCGGQIKASANFKITYNEPNDFPIYGRKVGESTYIDPATGKEVKVYAQCASCGSWGYDVCNLNAVSALPACSDKYYTQTYFANGSSHSGSGSYLPVSDTSLSCKTISEKHRGCSCSADVTDKDGKVIVSDTSSLNGMVNTYMQCNVSCAYRVCTSKDACQRADAPVCNTPGPCETGEGKCVMQDGKATCQYEHNDANCNAPGNCQANPGQCVAVDGKEICRYALSTEQCNADNNSCTYDSCASEDNGVTAACKAGPDLCGGLIPCGRLGDNPATNTIDESQPCSFCHLALIINNILNYLFELASILALLAIIVTGFLYILSGGNPQRRNAAKEYFMNIIKGYFIIFLAWLIVDFILSAWGFLNPIKGEWNVVCLILNLF